MTCFRVQLIGIIVDILKTERRKDGQELHLCSEQEEAKSCLEK